MSHIVQRCASAVGVVFEIPAACLSFGLYKTTRLVIRRLMQLYVSRNANLARRWRVVSAEVLQRSMVLPMIMTSAPRWNTHAIVGNIGPLLVQQSLGIQTASAENSAALWTIVVQSYPQNRPVVCLDSRSGPRDGAWHNIKLQAGSYSLVLRYYHWKEAVELPALTVDEQPWVAPQTVTPNVNDFYHDLPKRRNLFYLLLHYYIYSLLRFRKWLPQSFVQNEVLPMGNPETEFYYDAVQAKHHLHFSIDPAILTSHEVFYTLYSRDSFPIAWDQIRQPEQTTSVVQQNGFYLVRVHKKDSSKVDLDRARIRITVR